VARIIGARLQERLGQSFVIENKPGAGTNLAAQAVVASPPDGYTLLFVATTNAINATFHKTLPFDFLRDIAPVAGLVDLPFVLEVGPSVPAKTVAELIAYAKADPGKVNLASFGTGTISHLAGELFKLMAGVDMVHVPYPGGAPMVTDMIAGRVQAGIDALPNSLPHIQSGALRALAVTGPGGLTSCPTCRPSARPSRATRSAAGPESAFPPARRKKSSRRSTARSTPRSPIRASRRALPTWAAGRSS
jgi:tripartite-type tricarboxylate transporter receptor subunit TctC